MKALFLLTNADIRKTLGKKLKKYRVEAGYSQGDLHRKTGVSIHSISNIENGNDFNFDTLITILKFFRLVDNIDLLIPDVVENPYDVAKGLKNRQRRKRVSSTKNIYS